MRGGGGSKARRNSSSNRAARKLKKGLHRAGLLMEPLEKEAQGLHRPYDNKTECIDAKRKSQREKGNTKKVVVMFRVIIA
jgi:hypothetical protein